MPEIEGKYHLEKNENLDAFYAAVGVPWLARKMMLATSPTIHVAKDKNEEEEDVWDFKTVSFTRTVELSFTLNKPFEDTMPSGDVFMTTAKMEGDDKFILESESEDKGTFCREYHFTEDGMIMYMKHPSGVEAKRYFKRVPA